jgi:sec-independent protein translocase protein TatB
MFDIGWWELLIIAVIAIVVVGPKDLPKLMSKVGKWTAQARSMAREFQKSFEEMAREAELDELRREVNDAVMNNPLTDIKKDIEATLDTPKSLLTGDSDSFHPPTDDLADDLADDPAEASPDGAVESDDPKASGTGSGG